MHLKCEFETVEIDNQIIAVPVGEYIGEYRGVIKMNETANYIFSLLMKETEEKAVIEQTALKFGCKAEDIASDVHKVIQEFVEQGLIENENNC